MKLKLRYYGDSILRKKCESVEKIDKDIQSFVEDMIETAKAHDSIGLAAPQVGRTLRIFLVRNHIIQPNGQYKFTDFQVYINPKLSSPTDELVTMAEGCMSFPKFYPDITRPLGIHVEAQDIKGKIFHEELRGFKARQVMHENDHINGVLFIDRLEQKMRRQVEPILAQIKKQYKS